jgi:N-acetylneuraminic acid mutarotase
MIDEQRVYHASTILLDGRVLVVGGTDRQAEFTASTEIYDPTSDQWTAAESLDYKAIAAHALLLPTGQVLLTGGWRHDDQAHNACITPYTRLYDPGAGRWEIGPSLQNARVGHTATMLRNGTVLVAGGRPSVYSVLATTECLGFS